MMHWLLFIAITTGDGDHDMFVKSYSTHAECEHAVTLFKQPNQLPGNLNPAYCIYK